MSDKKLHQINICLIGFAVFVFLLLSVLHFVFALLWLLMCALVISVLARRNHPMYLVEKEIWTAKWEKYQKKRADKKRAYMQENHYTNEFVPDHMLVGIGEYAGEKHYINQEVYVIGTKPSCQCVLGKRHNAATISGEHCRIVYRKHSRAYYIEDLHSLNGTYLGTKRLEPNTPEKLLENAEITISHVRFCFVTRK